ncbi:MAG: FtsW/RodA/SpoVE family cell cycle protein [Candidatus Saccharibacteria bacterium]|nr:FtsW/RodA/SpoVE family cell cycle protein [Candidatus Saccharibacteria bacterium]
MISKIAKFNPWQNFKSPEFGLGKPKYRLLFPIIILLGFGVFMQFRLEPALQGASLLDSNQAYFWRHLLWVIVGLGVFWLGFKIKLQLLLKFSLAAVIIALILSLAAVVIGTSADLRWLNLGLLSVQPVEFLKVGFILLTAGYIYQAQSQVKQKESQLPFHKLFYQTLLNHRWSFILISLISIIVLILQKDLGSLAVIGCIFLGMLFITNIPKRVWWSLIVIGLLLGFLSIVQTSYRGDRLTTFWNRASDCQDLGYQVCQAQRGVGSGGLIGRGFNDSVLIYGWLPEAKNDTIFVTWAEVFGFIGSMVLIGFLSLLLFLIYRIGLRLEDRFKLIAAGLLIWLGFQAFINIGGNIGAIPLTGITLPLISAGGSSLIAILFILGIFLQISAYTIKKDETENYQNHDYRWWHRRSRHTPNRRS